LASLEGVVDLDLYRDTTAPQLEIRLDRQALARAGVAVEDAQTIVETALAGALPTAYWDRNRLVPVRVRLPASERRDPDTIGSILVPTPSGARVPLRTLADIRIVNARASINRENNNRVAALKFNVEGRDMGSAIAEAMAIVKRDVDVPEGH